MQRISACRLVPAASPRLAILGHHGPELVAKLGDAVAGIVVAVSNAIARPPDQAAELAALIGINSRTASGLPSRRAATACPLS